MVVQFLILTGPKGVKGRQGLPGKLLSLSNSLCVTSELIYCMYTGSPGPLGHQGEKGLIESKRYD